MVHVSAAKAVELHAAVKAYVDSADESAAGSLWPLVRHARLLVSGLQRPSWAAGGFRQIFLVSGSDV